MIFRPTCRVRLQLSLDEGATSVYPATAPDKQWLKGVGGTPAGVAAALDRNLLDRAALTSMQGIMSPPEFGKKKNKLDLERRQLQQIGSKKKQTYPGGVDPQQGRAQTTVVFEVLPMAVTIVRAPSKDADTVNLVFAFRDLPVDPRCVRSCLVSVALGAVSPGDYAAGMVDGKTRADGSSIALVEHEKEQELRLWSSTRFVGYCATWKATFDETGDTIQMDCVDVSCVMRTQKLLGHKVDLAKPIDQGIQELVDSFPTSTGLKVTLGTPIGRGSKQTTQAPTGELKPIDVMPKQMRTRRGKVAQATEKSEKETVWDHINDVALRLGLVPLMRGFTLYLTEPRVQYRDLENATKMVYGRNVKHLEITRKMEGMTLDTIEVRSPDRSIGRVRWARYPVLNGEPRSGILGKLGSPQPVTSRTSKVSPNGTGHETVRVLTVRGIANLATLEKIAEATFHEIARQEIAGVFGTDDIDSFETKLDADLLDLMPGQPVAILVEQQPQVRDEQGVSTLQEMQSLSVAARQRYLESKRISAEHAHLLAVAQEQSRLVSTFRAGYTTLRWSNEDGVSVECDFYNFVVVREDPASGEIVTGARPTSLSQALNTALK